jgi:hypothetical protein
MVMSLVGHGTKNNCAGEGQEQFSSQSDLGTEQSDKELRKKTVESSGTVTVTDGKSVMPGFDWI